MSNVEWAALAGLTDVRSILVIPFEDRALTIMIQRQFPQASVTVLSKNDLKGRALRRTILEHRKTSFDLAIASLYAGTVRRSLSSTRLLLSLFRASRFAIRTAEHSYQVSGLFVLLLQVFFKVVAGSVLAVPLMGWVLWSTRTHVVFRRTHFRFHGAREKPTALFLRTDLAGSIQTGGSASHIMGIVESFLRRGFRVCYLSDEYLSALPSEVRQIRIRPWGVFDFLDDLQLLMYNIQLRLQRNTIIRELAPDVVYQRHSVFGFSGPLFARYTNVPSILEVNASEVWVKKHWSRLWFSSLARRCERAALERADLVSVISEGVKNQLAGYRIEPERLLTNPNGVDTTSFHPGISGAAIRRRFHLGKSVVVGFVGTFHRWHGVETLAEAALDACSKRPTLRFLLMGDGELKNALQERIEKRRMANKILFTGMIPHQEIPSYLAACDIVVSPHLGFEDGTPFFGSPTKLFEYMAMGKAIIASNLEQLGTTIVHRRNGLQMNPGDVAGLSTSILLLAGNPSLRKRLGKQARLDAVRRYSWDQTIERIITHLQNTTK